MSKTLPLAIVAVLLIGTCESNSMAGEDEAGFVSMFNGKDLTGWEGKPGGWQVEEGTITGESTPEKPCKRSHYLIWKGGQPQDFILRVRVKLSGGNSGIQFRSQRRPFFDTDGYQADLDAENTWSGCVYQHKRGAVVKRGRRATIAEDGTRKEDEFASFDDLATKIKKDDWNDYEVTAKGTRITLRINGHLMCEVDDRDVKFSREKGIIALQMHQGPPMKVQFKNLRIRVLK
ncbi:MAG: DUF1080 domain-containing protein [Pirellulales bacterium]|nr:DUF1080 domain-containing protein [Pirellulales bacterium]